MNICKVSGCSRSHSAKGLCAQHYGRLRRHGDPLVSVRSRKTNGPDSCLVEGCLRSVAAKGYCQKHYYRWRSTGDPLKTKVAPNGSGWTSPSGYRYITKYGKPQLEHRLIMSEILGRDLLPEESVHHKNGDRADNRPENLELWSSSQPYGQRIEDKVTWAREILSLYENLVD